MSKLCYIPEQTTESCCSVSEFHLMPCNTSCCFVAITLAYAWHICDICLSNTTTLSHTSCSFQNPLILHLTRSGETAIRACCLDPSPRILPYGARADKIKWSRMSGKLKHNGGCHLFSVFLRISCFSSLLFFQLVVLTHDYKQCFWSLSLLLFLDFKILSFMNSVLFWKLLQ